jgi:hypothetical protein
MLVDLDHLFLSLDIGQLILKNFLKHCWAAHAQGGEELA